MWLERALVFFLFTLPAVNLVLAVWSALRYHGMGVFLNFVSFLGSLGAAVVVSNLLRERRRSQGDGAARRE